MAVGKIVRKIFLLVCIISLFLQQNEAVEISLSEEELIKNGHLGRLGEQGPIIEGEIEELDYFPNGQDFYEYFVRQRKPLVMRGVVKSWPAFKHWSNESYMREKYGEVLFEVDLTKRYEQKFPVKDTMTLNEFFDIYKTENVYLDSAFPQSNLTKDINLPYCLQCEELLSNINSIHLLYSSGDTSYVLHQDGYENLLTVFSGTKELLIADTSYTYNLHADEYLTVAGLSPIDPEQVDLIKYPRVAGVPFHKVILQAGDVLYNPQLWWHQVRSYNSPNIAISLWFYQFNTDKYEEEHEDQDGDKEDHEEQITHFTKKFEKAVQDYPSTIACRNQNPPLGTVFWPHGDSWETPSLQRYKVGMKTITLNTGYEVPLLGFGTGFLTDAAQLSTMTALKMGYRLFDTASAYNNEEAIGKVIILSGIPRQDIIIVDKIHPKDYYTEGATLKSIDSSLMKLQVEYIDVMLLHNRECDEEGGRLVCDNNINPTRDWKNAWEELENAVKLGKVRSIGVSNFEVEDLEELLSFAEIKPSLVQNLFDPFIQDRKVRHFCSDNNIAYMAYSVLGRSWFDIGFQYNPVLNNTVLQALSTSYETNIAQVVLRWALWHDVITIPRSSNPKHIALNFASQYLPLNEEDIKEIDQLQGMISEEQIDEALAKTYPDSKREELNKTEVIANPGVIVEREARTQELLVVFGSDDYWIYALDGNNGQLLWKHQTADETGSTCVFNDDETAVYCGADDKHVRAFHSNNGSLIWKYPTTGPVTSSVRIADSGALVFGCLDNHMYCVSAEGKLIWKHDLGYPVWVTPVLIDGGRLVLTAQFTDEPGTGEAMMLDGENGHVLWSTLIGGVFSSPAFHEGLGIVVYCTVDMRCYGISVDKREQVWILEADSEVYSSPSIQRSTALVFIVSIKGTMYAVKIKTGQIMWKKSVFLPEIRSSPLVLDDGTMYLATGGGVIQSLNTTNGYVIWSKKHCASGVEYFSSPRMSRNGLLFIGTIEGSMLALNATNGALVWNYKTDGAVVGTVRITKNHVVYTALRHQFNE